MRKKSELNPVENTFGMIGFIILMLTIIYFFVQQGPSHKEETHRSPEQTTTPQKKSPTVTINDAKRAA